MFETFPDELNEKWSFQLVNTTKETFSIGFVDTPDLIIIDTYSLGLDFINVIKNDLQMRNTPVLVIDEYFETVLINKIVESGATDYLHIDNFNDGLEGKIKALLDKPEHTRP